MLKALIKGQNKSIYIYSIVGFVFLMFIGLILKMYSEPTEILSQVVKTVGNNKSLSRSDDGSINILLIGVDKRENTDSVEQGLLTDTIILASINPDKKTYSLISFPRDIWIDNNFGGTETGYVGKINGIYTAVGINKLIKVVENLTKKKINYHVAVSFGGFIQTIDAIGGVEIYVENTFDDFAYPIEGKENDLCGLKQENVDKIFEKLNEQKKCTEEETCILFDNKNELEDKYDNIKDNLKDEYDNLTEDISKTFQEYLASKIEVKDENLFVYKNIEYELKVDDLDFPCRYESLHFNQGLQKMDGVTALKYARSRHAYGQEGSDFARAKRQQLVIDATRNKVLSLSTFSNPVKLKNLYDTYHQNVETNIGVFEAQAMYEMLSKIQNNGSYVISISDDPSTGGILDSLYGGEEYDFAFVLIPKNKNYNAIAEFIAMVLNKPVITQ